MVIGTTGFDPAGTKSHHRCGRDDPHCPSAQHERWRERDVSSSSKRPPGHWATMLMSRCLKPITGTRSTLRPAPPCASAKILADALGRDLATDAVLRSRRHHRCPRRPHHRLPQPAWGATSSANTRSPSPAPASVSRSPTAPAAERTSQPARLRAARFISGWSAGLYGMEHVSRSLSRVRHRDILVPHHVGRRR